MIALGGGGGGGRGASSGMGGARAEGAGGSIVHTKNAVAFKDVLTTEPGENELTLSHHGRSTKAHGVPLPHVLNFSHPLNISAAPVLPAPLEFLHHLSVHPWRADCTHVN